MSKLVRAKHPNGGEFTTSEAHAKRNRLTIVDKPTHDRHGRLLPAKPAGPAIGANPPSTPSADDKKGAGK